MTTKAQGLPVARYLFGRAGLDHWWESAACLDADPELFFPQEGAPREERLTAEYEAKQYCLRCPVRQQCLMAAVSRQEKHGIWGGLTARERSAAFAA